MSSESLNRLSDFDLHKRLIQSGFPNTPVTETTRAILIKKLKKHNKAEKLKKRTLPNYVLYSEDHPDQALPHTTSPQLQTKPNAFGNILDNNNDSKSCRNPSVFYANNLDEFDANTLQISASRMYAPPPVLASNYDNECESLRITSKYRKQCPLPSSVDASSNSYSKTNSKSNLSDGRVVNRLLSFRDATIQKKLSRPYTVHVAKQATPTKKRFAIPDLTSFFRKPDSSQNIIPQVLIALLLIFLTIITVLYAAKKFDKSPIDKTGLKFTLCNQHDRDLSLANEKVTCISKDLLDAALHLSEQLFHKLNERARQHHCKNENLSPTLEFSEFVQELTSNGDRTQLQRANLQNNLLATKYLIMQNPQWMIRSSGNSASFELTEPKLPLKCIVLKKMSRFFTVLGSLILVISGCLIIYFGVVVYRVRQKESLLAAEQLAKDIINELVCQNAQSESPEVIITQLQEKLVPANKRSKLLPAWNKALKMLETNDNRVLFGMVIRDGKQLRTMTWSRNVDKKDFARAKKWQSPAFDNSNKIANPPTPCLKIRHMFDSTEVEQPNLKQLIVESIFEKVGPLCKICDVQLDTQSCCVYIRCASETDAGMIHNEINGWWFDKRLISIKFLRLERYLSRFPKPSTEPLYFIPHDVSNSHS